MGESYASRITIYDRDDLMKLDELDKQITSSDLEALETFADRIFAKVGIDVEFTRHFLDRVNDERNGKQITASELTRLFKQEYKRWGQPIAQMGPDQEAVMKDLVTDINMPFALRWDKENEELDLIVKTVMRKPDFKTSNKEFPVEGRGLYSMGGKSGLRHRPTIRSRTSSASFLPKPIKKPSLLKRIFSDEFSEEATQKPYVSMYRDRDNRNKMVYDVLDKYGDSAFKSYDEDEAQKYFKDNYKAMREDIKEDSQIWKWNKEDPNNPEVLIQGYGRLMLNQIEDSVVGKLKELTKMAERGDFEQIQSLLDRDVMQIMMKAVVDTKAELQATRKRGGPKSRGINKESILDVIGRSEIEELDEESPWELFKRKIDPTIHNNRYQKAAERLHSVLKRKEKENSGKWRHALGWYVSKIASSFKGIDSRALQDYYLKNFDAVLEDINEAGGVGKVVPGINTTVDVGPNEITKQAAKFGNKVSKDGLPKKTFR